MDDLIARLGRRIHNQRVRLREMEGFHWGANHLATIRSYSKLLMRCKAQSAELTALKAKVEALENRPVVAWIHHSPYGRCFDGIFGKQLLDAERDIGWTETPLVAKEV